MPGDGIDCPLWQQDPKQTGLALPGAFSAGSVTVGVSGTPIASHTRYAQALTPVAVAANTTAEQTFTVTGVPAGAVVIAVNKPTAQAGLGIVGARVSAPNTVAITFSNVTAGSLTPTAAETYQIVVES